MGNRRIEGIDTSNLGNVNREQGKLEEAEGKTASASRRYQTAFVLLHRAIEKEALLQTPEFTERRSDLIRRLAAAAGS